MNLRKKVAYYSEVIIGYLFWVYFLFFVFFYKTLPVVYTYILFLLTGLFIGYKLAIWAMKTLKRKV